MSSQNKYELTPTKRKGSGEQPLPPIHETTSSSGTPRPQLHGLTTQQPPPKWPLVGLAQEKENRPKKQTAQGNAQSALRRNSGLSDNSTPPQLPPRRRVMTESTRTRKENPPNLPPRNTAPSSYQKEASTAGFVNSRKGGFSGDPKMWKNEREKVSQTGRVACAPPTLHDEWVRAPETLSLLQFVEKCSDSLPAEVRVEKGYYGSNDPETVGNEEKLIISYVKSRKLLTIITTDRQKYCLPLGSAVQLSLLYNPNGNEEKAREGYTFQTVGDLVSQSPHLPKIVCATKVYKGDSLKSTVYDNELLLVMNFNAQTEKLHVISLGQNPISKLLPIKCSGCFTTKPAKVRMHVSDIDKHIGTSASILELQAELELSELKRMSVGNPIDQSLEGIVKVSGFVTERSLIVTRIAEECSSLSAPEKKVFEIPVNDNLSDVAVTVIRNKLTEKHLPHPSSMEDELELWNQQDSTAATKMQRLFNDFVRHGLEREGVNYNAACNVYDEPHNPATSTPGILAVTPYATHDLLQRDLSSSIDHEPHDADMDTSALPDLDTEENVSQNDYQPSDSDEMNDHTQDTKDEGNGGPEGAVTNFESELIAFKSKMTEMVSEMMTEKLKALPDVGGHYYTSMNPNEDLTTRVKLNEVILELSEIENLWYMFGIRLGVKKTKLDQIFANYGSGPSPCGRCFIETISYWENNIENATWSSIVEALYSMERKQLAKKVADKHKVMLPVPIKFTPDRDDFANQLKEFVSEDRLPEISSRHKQIQEKDDRLHEVQERLGQYEQRIEEYRNNLKDIKNQLLFNERFTRMLTRENQLLRMKQAYKEQQIRIPSQQGNGAAGRQKTQETLRKEIQTLHEAQETYENRLQGAHHDTMELQQKLFSIEGQMKGIKKHLDRLQDQKRELTTGLREQECELSSIITESISKDSKESDEEEEEELPQYYNIIRCDGKVEVKLHEEELKMLQQELDRKTAEVGNLKKELQTKHERMTHVGLLLQKQESDEMEYSYTDASELNVLEKHQNDHLKTRLQMEKLDCQIQLTSAWLQKRDVELKFDLVKQCLDMSKDVCQRAQELFENSTRASGGNSIKSPVGTMSKRSVSLSSTASEESDVFSSRSSSITQTASPLHTSFEAQSEESQAEVLQIKNTAGSQVPTSVATPVKKSTSATTAEHEITEEQDGGLKTIEKTLSSGTAQRKSKNSTPRQRSNALPAGSQNQRKGVRMSSSGSTSSQSRRLPSAQGPTPRLCHKTQNALNNNAKK